MRLVYIVEQSTGNLVGSSLNITVTGGVLLRAINAPNSLVAKSALYLTNNSWPTEKLIVFDGYYIQVTQFKNLQLSWWVVVMQPAPSVIDYLAWDAGSASYAALTIIAISLFLQVGVFVGFMVYRKGKVFTMSQSEFMLMFLVGSITLTCFCFILLGSNSDMQCTIRAWFFPLAVTFCLSPLLVKSYRLHLIFNNTKLTDSNIPPLTLVLICLSMWVVDIVLLFGWEFSNGTGNVVTTEVGNDNAYYQHVRCITGGVPSLLIVAYIAARVAIGCVLSFLTRNLESAFSETKALLVTMYFLISISC